jgi:hypothetical protein
MKAKKKNHEALKSIIYMEGLSYAYSDYLEADQIEDEEIAEAWKKARVAHDELLELLTTKGINTDE